jgi:hypothetical protein
MVTVGRADGAIKATAVQEEDHVSLALSYGPVVELRQGGTHGYQYTRALDSETEYDSTKTIPRLVVSDSSLPHRLCLIAACNLQLQDMPVVVVRGTDPRNFTVHHVAMELFDEDSNVAVVVWLTKPGIPMPVALAVGWIRVSCRDSADSCQDSDVWCLSLGDTASDLYVSSGADDGHGNVFGSGVNLPKPKKRALQSKAPPKAKRKLKPRQRDDQDRAMDVVEEEDAGHCLRWFTAFTRCYDACKGHCPNPPKNQNELWDCTLLMFAAFADIAGSAGLACKFNRRDKYGSLAELATLEATQYGLISPAAFGVLLACWLTWKRLWVESAIPVERAKLAPPDEQLVKVPQTAMFCEFLRLLKGNEAPYWQVLPRHVKSVMDVEFAAGSADSTNALTVSVLAAALLRDHGPSLVHSAAMDPCFDMGAICTCLQRKLDDASWLHQLSGSASMMAWLACAGVGSDARTNAFVANMERGCSNSELIGQRRTRSQLVPAAPTTSHDRLEAACLPACVRWVFAELYGTGEPASLGNEVRWQFSMFMSSCLHPTRPILPALAKRSHSLAEVLSDAAQLIVPEYDGESVRNPEDLKTIVARMNATLSDPNNDPSKRERGCHAMMKQARLTDHGINRKNNWHCPHAVDDIEEASVAFRRCREDIQNRLALLEDGASKQLPHNWHANANRPLLVVNQALAAAATSGGSTAT